MQKMISRVFLAGVAVVGASPAFAFAPTVSVPEPGGLGILAAAGVIGAIVAYRRRRK